MPNYTGTDLAYDFFCTKEKDNDTFTFAELAVATNWSRSTVLTYYSKKWRNLVQSEDNENFSVTGIQSLTLEEFRDHQSQVAPPQLPPEDITSRDYNYDVALSFAGEDREKTYIPT